MNSLPPEVGTILMQNIGILQVVSMFAIGAYNALETGIVTFDTFKHYRGLYFYSMQVASLCALLATPPRRLRHQKTPLGTMDDHHQCGGPPRAHDSPLLRPH